MKHIPSDKSWIIRLGVLDILNGEDYIDQFLAKQTILSSDLQALARASEQWKANLPIDVGESGTLYRFLQFASWKRNENRKFIKHGTLKDRRIADDPSIVTLPLEQLLKLDNGTSQWASASVLLGNTEDPPKDVPYKLKLTYEAVDHWKSARQNKHKWTPRKDQTISQQAKAYIQWLQTGKIDFIPEQAEDYCFARAFELMTPEQGEARWPSLRQHESDRIASMEIALSQQLVDSADHRVVQAIAMRRGDSVSFSNPESVSKSWPEFWDFMKSVHSDTI